MCALTPHCAISHRPADGGPLPTDTPNVDVVVALDTADAPLPDLADATMDANDAPDVPPPDGARPDVVTDAGCPAGQSLCAGACVDPLTNGSHCGGCGMSCAMPFAPGACVAGRCATMCMPPGRVCPGGSCVVESDTSCGPTCMPCSMPLANGRYVCAAGACGPQCNATFMLSAGICIAVARCGNRGIDGPETCDDGNIATGDGCDATCRAETGARVDACGDSGVRTVRPSLGVSVYVGDTNGRTANAAGTCMADGPDELWTLQPPAGATSVVVDLIPMGFDAAIRIATGTCTNSVVCIDANGGMMPERAMSPVTAGTVIWVFADGNAGGDHGMYQLRVDFR